MFCAFANVSWLRITAADILLARRGREDRYNSQQQSSLARNGTAIILALNVTGAILEVKGNAMAQILRDTSSRSEILLIGRLPIDQLNSGLELLIDSRSFWVDRNSSVER